MRIIKKTPSSSISEGNPTIAITADRRTLAKRRWKVVAEDGEEFGFDLEHPLANGATVFESDQGSYIIEQAAEPILRIPFSDAKQAAYLGWMVGNLHFSAAFDTDAVLAEDDPAVRQMLERNDISFDEVEAVFEPTIISRGHHH